MAKKNGKVVNMMVTPPNENGLAVIQQEYNPKLTQALTYKAVTQEQFNQGGELLKVFSNAKKAAEVRRDETLVPAKLTVKRIEEQWDPFFRGLKSAVEYIKSQMLGFTIAEAQRIAKEREKILSDQRLKPETVEKKLATVFTAPTSNTRKTLVLEITDESKIPREYLVVDEVKLKAALKEGVKVPGAKLVNSSIIVTR